MMNSQPITDMLSHLDQIKEAVAILNFMKMDCNSAFREDIDSRLEVLNYERKDVEFMLVQEYESMSIQQVFTDLRR